jgi:hypothetical protein
MAEGRGSGGSRGTVAVVGHQRMKPALLVNRRNRRVGGGDGRIGVGGGVDCIVDVVAAAATIPIRLLCSNFYGLLVCCFA